MTTILPLSTENIHSPALDAAPYAQQKMRSPQTLVAHLQAISPSPQERNCPHTDLSMTIPEKIRQTSELIPYAGSAFNAGDYVFLGSCEMPVVSDMGITLNETGRLVLIAGHCHDAIAGLFHKYLRNDGFRYYLFGELHQPYRLRFDRLYVDEKGLLIGKLKGRECYYSICIDKKTSYHHLQEVQYSVGITYEKRHVSPRDNLVFSNKSGHPLAICCRNGDLFVKADSNISSHSECNQAQNKISLALNKKYRVASIKRARNVLQIEAIGVKKRRIFYLDPSCISLSDFTAKGISHKPPQTFFSCLGGDTHEKYYSGQPFSSSRLSNFSSAHIPLFSTLVDNIRCQTKKSKQCRARGKKNAAAMPYLAKSLDPGLRAVVATAKDMSRTHTHCDESDNVKRYRRNSDDMARTCISLLHELPDSIARDKSQAGVSVLLHYLEKKDSLTFSNASELSLFFSMLQSGAPFNPGWFAGLIIAFAKTHGITFSRSDNGNIRLCFTNKRKISCTLLAGSGQGLETGKIKSGGINMLSVMPFEANLMLAAYRNKEENFSFEINESDFHHLIQNTANPDNNAYPPPFANTVITQTNEYGGALSIDMKISEVRAMVDIKPSADVKLLVPRFSGALALNGELLALKHQTRRQHASGAFPTESPRLESINTVRGLTATGGPSTGGKVIVSPYVPNPSGKLGLRVALYEESNSRKIKTMSGAKYQWQHSTSSASHGTTATHRRQIDRIHRLLADIDTTGEVIRPIEKLRHVKITRALWKKQNPFLARLISLLTRKPHPSRNRISTVLKNQRNKSEIVHTLKQIRSHARRTQRTSMNKRLTHYFIAKYTLNGAQQEALSRLSEELATVEKNAEGLSHQVQRQRLNQLQRRARQLRRRACYRLNAIELKSIGEISKIKASFLNVIVSFKNTKTLSYTKHLGDIQFEYGGHDDSIPQKIVGDYRFL